MNILFLSTYEIFFKPFLLSHFKNFNNSINQTYYSGIFSYLEFPIIFTTLVLLLILLNYDRVKKLLDYIKNEKLVLIIVILINVVVQLYILFNVKTIPIADSKYYIDLAVRLFYSGSYSSPTGHLTSYWPIGLPAVLSGLMFLTSNYLLLIKLFNIIISSSLIVVLYFLFKSELSKKGMAIFLIAFTIYPNNLFSVNCVLTEYPFTFLIWLAALLILKGKNKIIPAVLIPIVLGLASYLRPVGLLLPLIFVAYYIKFNNSAKSIKYIFLTMFFFCLVIAPWTYRNYKVFNKFVPISTNGGSNFLMGNHKNSSGGINFDFKFNTFISETEASSKAYSEGIRDIIGNPIQSLIRLPKKILFSYYRGDSSVTWSLKETKNYVSPVFLSFAFFSANYFFYLLVLISGLYLITTNGRVNSRSLKYFLLILYFYFILIIVVYVGSERYLIPVLPVHFFLFGKYFS